MKRADKSWDSRLSFTRTRISAHRQYLAKSSCWSFWNHEQLITESSKIRLCSESSCEPHSDDRILLFLHIREQVPNYQSWCDFDYRHISYRSAVSDAWATVFMDVRIHGIGWALREQRTFVLIHIAPKTERFYTRRMRLTGKNGQ